MNDASYIQPKKFWQKVPRIKDSTILGLISGFIGVLAMDIVDIIGWLSGKHEMLYGHLAGSMIFHPLRMHRGENFFIGKMMHLLTGALQGCLLTLFFKKTGKDHHIIKGSIFGIVAWLTLYEFGQNRKWFTLKARKSSTFYFAFLANIVYGASTAHAIVTMAHPSIFEKTTLSSSNQTKD